MPLISPTVSFQSSNHVGNVIPANNPDVLSRQAVAGLAAGFATAYLERSSYSWFSNVTSYGTLLAQLLDYLGYFKLLWNHSQHRLGHNLYQAHSLPRLEDLNPALAIDETLKFASKNTYVSVGYSVGKLLAGSMPQALVI